MRRLTEGTHFSGGLVGLLCFVLMQVFGKMKADRKADADESPVDLDAVEKIAPARRENFVKATRKTHIWARPNFKRRLRQIHLSEIVQGAARNLAQSLPEIFRVRRLPAKIALIAKVNGGHKLSPDLRATN